MYVSASGGLYSQVPFDYEAVPSFVVQVTVQDNGVACDYRLDLSQCEPIATTTTVVVAVQNVNEPPTLTADTFTIAENLASGSLIGKPIRVIDADGAVGNDYGFTIFTGTSSGAGSEFKIRRDGRLLTQTTLDFEAKSNYVLRIGYYDGEFWAYLNITVVVLDENEAPSIIGGVSGSIAENMAAGTPVLVAEYYDADRNSVNVFALMDTFAPFSINGTTGVLQTTHPLDFENDPISFKLNIRVRRSSNDSLWEWICDG